MRLTDDESDALCQVRTEIGDAGDHLHSGIRQLIEVTHELEVTKWFFAKRATRALLRIQLAQNHLDGGATALQKFTEMICGLKPVGTKEIEVEPNEG